VVEPGIPVQANCVELNPGATVTIRWPQAPSDFAMIEFWTRSEGGSTNVIGIDDNPADGAAITWTVPVAPFNVRLYAIPYTDLDASTAGEITIYTGAGQD
jgi:hypothetical protein